MTLVRLLETTNGSRGTQQRYWRQLVNLGGRDLKITENSKGPQPKIGAFRRFGDWLSSSHTAAGRVNGLTD